MINKREVDKEIRQSLNTIQQKYSNRVQQLVIESPTDIRVRTLSEQQMINKLVEQGYDNCQNDGMLTKEYSSFQIKTLLYTKLNALIKYMRDSNIKVSFSTGLDYMETVPWSFFIEGANALPELVQRLRKRGQTHIGIYSIQMCSQVSCEPWSMYTKTLIRIHCLSDHPKLTNKINRYYHSLREPYQGRIKDISDIHRRSRTFIRALEDSNIEIEYTKQDVPCFLSDNDTPVIARGYVIPVQDCDIDAFVQKRFANIGANKVIISQVTIYPEMLDKDLNIFQLFAIWVHVVNCKSWYQQEQDKLRLEQERIKQQQEDLKLKELGLTKTEFDDLRFAMIEGVMTLAPRQFLGMTREFWNDYDQWKKSNER